MGHPAAEVLDALIVRAGPSVDEQGARYGTIGILAGVRVFDGPPLEGIEDLDAIALGLSIDDVAGAVGDTRPGWGGDRVESFELAGITQSWSGDVAMAPRRARALQLLDGVRSLLAADPTVGGKCMRAFVAQWSYRPEQSSAGSLAVVTYSIRVDARRFEGV